MIWASELKPAPAAEAGEVRMFAGALPAGWSPVSLAVAQLPDVTWVQTWITSDYVGPGTLAADGKFYFAPDMDDLIRSYDPITGAVETFPFLAWANKQVAALPDGQLLLVAASMGGPSADVYMFDPSTGSVTEKAALPRAIFDPAVVTLATGDVLVIGGLYLDEFSQPTLTNECHRYDRDLNAWVPVASLQQATASGAAVQLADGRVLHCGGRATAGGDTSTATPTEILDPTGAAWTAVAPGPIEHYAAAKAIYDADTGAVTVFKATGVSRYTVGTDAWETVESAVPMSYGTHIAAAAVCSDGRCLMFGQGELYRHMGYMPLSTDYYQSALRYGRKD